MKKQPVSNTDKITIQELLLNRGLDVDAKIKLVRHKDERNPLYEWYKSDKKKFFDYQNQQSKNVFEKTEFIVSFIGEESSLARFVGVYRIEKIIDKKKMIKGVGGPYQFLHTMTEVDGFEALKERVIIDWGKSGQSWHQWFYNKKEVVQIQPSLLYKPFTDYFDFILDFAELKEIVKLPHPDWKKMLSATKGIYLITDSKTGKQYVGAAYKDDGIWGRWKTYVNTKGRGGNPGNKQLRGLVDKDPKYARHFKFSILMLLPKSTTQPEAINKETIFKNKLGSRAHGLNSN